MKLGKTVNLTTIIIKEVPDKVGPFVIDGSVVIPLSADASIHVKVDDLHDFVKYLTVVEEEVGWSLAAKNMDTVRPGAEA